MQFSSQRREVFVLVHRNEIPILLTVETDDLLLPVVTSLPFTGHAIQPPPLPHVQHVHRHSYRHSDGGARREEELDARDVPPPARPVYPRHRQREQREANVLQRRDDPESRPREPAGDGERHGRPQDRSVEGVRHALPDHGQYRGNGRQGHCQVDDEEERRRRRGDLRPLPHPVDEVAQRRARQRRDQVGDRHDPPGLLCRGVLFCAEVGRASVLPERIAAVDVAGGQRRVDVGILLPLGAPFVCRVGSGVVHRRREHRRLTRRHVADVPVFVQRLV
mmetsp:Transcript_38285/g.91673  ORF Transcript_38285/g.91673 Transcript_38285/m.91673 type:complete len:277 (-) Transcript_38285:901-1731(-)